MITFDLAIQILEGLKDHINDDGKRELGVVQKAIGEWQVLGLSSVIAEKPAPAEVPAEAVKPEPKPPVKVEPFKPVHIRTIPAVKAKATKKK